MNPALITPEHVHTDICWKESLSCAIAHIQEQDIELGRLRTMIAQYQLAIRDIGGMLDRMEAAFARALNGRKGL